MDDQGQGMGLMGWEYVDQLQRLAVWGAASRFLNEEVNRCQKGEPLFSRETQRVQCSHISVHGFGG